MKRLLIALMTLGLLTACVDVEEEPEKEAEPIETQTTDDSTSKDEPK